MEGFEHTLIDLGATEEDTLAPEVRDWVLRTVADETDTHKMAALIRQGTTGVLSDGLLGVCMALDYDRRFDWSPGAIPFEPLFNFPAFGVYPPPLEALETTWMRPWTEVPLDACPIVMMARLGHLLWLTRTSSPKPAAAMAAATAIAAYVESSEILSRPDTERAADLACALDLALSLKSSTKRDFVVERLRGFILDSESGASSAGAAIRGLAALGAMPVRFRPDLRPAARDLLGRFDDPHLQDHILSVLQAVANTDAERRAIAAERVQIWVAAAKSGSSLIRQMLLVSALEIALDNGLQREVAHVVVLMQTIDVHVDMTELMGSASVTTEQWETWVAGFLAHPSCADSVAAFGIHIPVLDDSADERDRIRDEMQRTPLQYLATRLIVDESGFVRKVIRDDMDHLEHALIQDASLRINFWGISSALIIKELHAKWPADATGDLLFPSPDTPELARIQFEQALDLHLRGEYRAALHVCLPAIETTLRGWARKMGLATYALQAGFRVQPIGLGGLLSGLRPYMPRNLSRYLSVLLVDFQGLNLRNRALHGSMVAVHEHESAAALHAAVAISHRQLIEQPA